MQKHSFVLVICRDLIITLVQCFCIFYFSPKAVSQKNGETQNSLSLVIMVTKGYNLNIFTQINKYIQNSKVCLKGEKKS